MVIVVIGILAAIAVPVFLNQRNKAYDTSAKSDLRTAMTALMSQAAFSTNGFTQVTAEMQAVEPSITWLSSNGVNTVDPPPGVVTWEWARGGGSGNVVVGIRSRSNKCFYLRIVDDPGFASPGVSYLSKSSPCEDVWDLTEQITRSAY